MKNFNDFIDTITQEDIDTLSSALNEESDTKTNLGTKIATQQYLITMHLLHRYHDWLQSEDTHVE